MALMCFPAPPYRCSTNALLHACAAPYALTLHEATPFSRVAPCVRYDPKNCGEIRARATADERSSSERSVLLRATMDERSSAVLLRAPLTGKPA